MKCALILLAVTSVALAVPVEEDPLKEFSRGNQKFTAAVYKELLKENEGDFIYSPLSAETVLALANEGARGDTSEEFITGLSLPSTKENIRKAFKLFLPRVKTSNNNLKLLSANKIYVGDDVKLENDFKSVAKDIFDSSVENIEFGKNYEAAAKINGWVANNTNQKIQDLINPVSLSNDTKLVLVNALYFNGNWSSPFKYTRKEKFYKSQDDVVEVDTMYQIAYFNYYESKDVKAKFLELKYDGANVSMVIVLPNEQEGLARLEENVEKLFAPQPFSVERVDVRLPKFNMSTKIEFVPILQELGIKKAFTYDSDLSGISSTYKELYISEVIQKAFINVTETGTEAAAATAIIGVALSAPLESILPQPYPFYADRPFLYYMKVQADASDDSKPVIIYAGRYTGNI